MPAFRDRLRCWRRRCGGRGLALRVQAGLWSGARSANRVTRTHLIVMTIVAGLVAGSCGSDNGSDDNADGSTADTAAVTSAVSTAGPEDPPEPDASSETAQPDLVAERVRLGSRFGWCAEIQDVWDAHTAASAREAEAANMWAAAVDAHDAATDELNKAEAAIVLRDTYDAYSDARADADEHVNAAIEPLLRSVARGGADPIDIAYRRAWEEFASEASPAEVDLIRLRGDVYDLETRPPPATTAVPMGIEAAAASDAAAEFSAQAVASSDEAIAALAALRDALVAARDASDAGDARDAAAGAVTAAQLMADIAAAVAATHNAASQAANAVFETRRAVEHAETAGLAGVDPGLLDNATASQSAAEAAQTRMREEFSREFSDNIWDYWDLEQAPGQSLRLVTTAAYSAVLLHSTAYLAFARSLGESCQ